MALHGSEGGVLPRLTTRLPDSIDLIPADGHGSGADIKPWRRCARGDLEAAAAAAAEEPPTTAGGLSSSAEVDSLLVGGVMGNEAKRKLSEPEG